MEWTHIPQPVKCPFHDDSSKSAKLFDDGLWCWAEHKRYGSYDLMILLGHTDAQILKSLSKTDMVLTEDENRQFTEDEAQAGLLRNEFIRRSLTFTDYRERLRVLYGEKQRDERGQG